VLFGWMQPHERGAALTSGEHQSRLPICTVEEFLIIQSSPRAQAIEAGRAGEQGRGFAVVADEVRKLAERTSTATKEIAQMIETVQKETNGAGGQMQTGTKQVEAGVATTSKAGASLKEIITAAQQVGNMISQIATAATQQSITAEQINSSVEQIAKITHESAAGVQQSAKACQDLANLAIDLQDVVGKFKTGTGAMRRQQAPIASPSPNVHVIGRSGYLN
jgi:uncharacterized phage infection (PIP) family protein YhgE